MNNAVYSIYMMYSIIHLELFVFSEVRRFVVINNNNSVL